MVKIFARGRAVHDKIMSYVDCPMWIDLDTRAYMCADIYIPLWPYRGS